MKRTGVVLGTLLVLASSSPAWSGSTSEPSEVDPKLRGHIITLMQLNGTREGGQFMMDYSIKAMMDMVHAGNPEVPDSLFEAIRAEMTAFLAEEMPGFLDAMVPVYAAHYSDDEILQLIAFYRTPLGQKVGRLTPVLAREGAVAGEAWGRSLQPRIAKRLEARLGSPGLQGK